MNRAARFWQLMAGLTGLILTACETTDRNLNGTGADSGSGAGAGSVDVGFLLSMSYEEAKKLTPQHLDMAPFCRVAADNIVVLKQTEEGVPLRVRATGRVFLEVAGIGGMVALGQEAYVDRAVEVIVRGRPLLRRGKSLVEGLTDQTVFYVRGSRLQVIGNHRFHPWQNPGAVSTMAGSIQSGRRRDANINVTPNWRKSWQQGPNPLLPALSPEDIPAEMRASPLLPPPDGDDQPKLPGETPTPSVEVQGTESRSLGRRLGEDRPPRARRVQ